MEKSLRHYGTPRRSGRYPWGSGDDSEQRNTSFRGHVNELKKQGMGEPDIAKGLGMSVAQMRSKISREKDAEIKSKTTMALKLKDKGYSNVEIGKRMGGINESSVRALLKPGLQQRSEITKVVAKTLKDGIDQKNYIDVGVGIERYLGVSRTKLKTAIESLKDEGYTLHYVNVPQLGTTHETRVMVLAKPGTPYKDVYKNRDQIRMITDHYSEDGGRTMLGIEPPAQISSKRIKVHYAEDGGKDKDGIIELRRGVEDISLGKARYAQVRIAVDGTHYLKGMAIYSDDMPSGTDIIFNTNKKTGLDKLAAMKVMSPDMNHPKAKQIQLLNISKDEKDNLLKKGVVDGSIKPDPDNPFGSTIRQRHYLDASGKKQLSALNIVSSGDKLNEEGRWGEWSKNLSSQMLSKQRPALAKKQLGLAYDSKKQEFDELMALTNPTVKKKLLESFADDADSSAVHLKAAAMSRQGSHVILPFPNMKETEIYAPNYRDGEDVVLIRHPHGGIFEIPQLKVNNKNPDAKRLIPGALDAVGIHPKVAERLSGADFDGDTVIVIPNSKGEIKSSSPLKGLMNFDPKESYPAYEGMKTIKPKTKQLKMGDVSNLITDMTIKGADTDEIARAVRHSMVVIDSEKHNLNYKQSYVDNGIAALKKKYQGKETGGAATLISKASSQRPVGTRKELPHDPITGKKRFEYTNANETYVNKEGKTVKKIIKSTKMAEEEDAFKLSSGTPMEAVYAEHANKLKTLANDARKVSVNTDYIPYSPSAKKTYEAEVDTLKSHLNIALKNAPLERQAQILANAVVAAKRKDNPDMDFDEIKKIKGQALIEARTRVGAKKQAIPITARQWEAIQAGAISTNTLTQILNNTDLDRVKQLATPRARVTMPATKIATAKQMLAKGSTMADVADRLGVSLTTLNKALNR